MKFTQAYLCSYHTYFETEPINQGWLKREAFSAWTEFVGSQSIKRIVDSIKSEPTLSKIGHCFDEYDHDTRIELLFPVMMPTLPTIENLLRALVVIDLSAHFHFLVEYLQSQRHKNQLETMCTKTWRSIQDTITFFTQNCSSFKDFEFFCSLLRTYQYIINWMCAGYINNIASEYVLTEANNYVAQIIANVHLIYPKVFANALLNVHAHASYESVKSNLTTLHCRFTPALIKLFKAFHEIENKNVTRLPNSDFWIHKIDDLLWIRTLRTLHNEGYSQINEGDFRNSPALHSSLQNFTVLLSRELQGKALELRIQKVIHTIKNDMLTMGFSDTDTSPFVSSIYSLHPEVLIKGSIHQTLQSNSTKMLHFASSIDDAVTVKQAVQLTGRSDGLLRKWVRNGKLKNHGLKKSPLYSKHELLELDASIPKRTKRTSE